MGIEKLTFDDKTNLYPFVDRTRQICAEDINELKTKFNDNIDENFNRSNTPQLGYKLLADDFDFASIPADYDNSIWEIRKVYDLDGGDIVLPENITLKFIGGKLTNYNSITGDKTRIDSGLNTILDGSGTLSGTWNVAEVYPEWFGAVGDGATDDTDAIQAALDSGIKHIKLRATTYAVTSLVPVNATLLISDSISTEFTDSSTIIKSIGTTPLFNPTVKVSRFMLNGIKFEGGDNNVKFLPTGTLVPDLEDCQFLNCSWNHFYDIFENVTVLRCKVDNYYINNCRTEAVPWHWKGSDSYIGKGFLGNNSIYSTPTEMLYLSACGYIFIDGMYITGDGSTRNIRLTGAVHVIMNNVICDISNDGAIYMNGNSGPIYFNNLKCGYNNLDPATFTNGILSLFSTDNVYFNHIALAQQTITPTGSARASVDGYGILADANCQNIFFTNLYKDPLYTNADSINTAAVLYFDAPLNYRVIEIDTEPVLFYDVVDTYLVTKIITTYVATAPKQFNLQKGAKRGTILKWVNETTENNVIADYFNGEIDSVAPSGEGFYLFDGFNWSVY